MATAAAREAIEATRAAVARVAAEVRAAAEATATLARAARAAAAAATTVAGTMAAVPSAACREAEKVAGVTAAVAHSLPEALGAAEAAVWTVAASGEAETLGAPVGWEAVAREVASEVGVAVCEASETVGAASAEEGVAALAVHGEADSAQRGPRH